jgi:cytidine deaminase
MPRNIVTSKLIRNLKDIASREEGVGWGYKLAACVLDKRGRVIEARPNSYKTHPVAKEYNGWGHLHAELNAVIASDLDDCSCCTVVVIRVHRNGNLACSRPCDGCRSFLEDRGFQSVVFVDEEGDLIEEDLN